MSKQQHYRIVPAVTTSGELIYKLYRDWHLPTPFGLLGGTVFVAQNTDRSVLERAKEHLNGPAEVK